MKTLERLLSQDFTLTNESGRYARTVEHDSLVLDREADLFYWNSQGVSGNAFWYLVKIRGMSAHEARDFLGEDKSITHVFDDCDDKRNGAYVGDSLVVYPKLVEIFHNYGRHHREYWHDVRGYTDKTIDRFKLGYTGEWYTIPIFVHGLFKNFQARKIMPDGKKRVKNWYRGVGALPFNFSILNMTDWVVITEGPVDAIMLRQNNIPAVSHNGGAEYWNMDWNVYFSKMKRIFVVYDNDVAGNAGAIKVARNWSRARVYNFWDFDAKFDVTDYFKNCANQDDFLRLIHGKSRFYYEIEV